MRLGVAAQQTANGHYRAILPLQEMARRGHTIHWPWRPAVRALQDGAVPQGWDAATSSRCTTRRRST